MMVREGLPWNHTAQGAAVSYHQLPPPRSIPVSSLAALPSQLRQVPVTSLATLAAQSRQLPGSSRSLAQMAGSSLAALAAAAE